MLTQKKSRHVMSDDVLGHRFLTPLPMQRLLNFLHIATRTSFIK